MNRVGRRFSVRIDLARYFVFALTLCGLPAWAAQTDIHGPTGSAAFGSIVYALPNGNFVVIDPQFSSGSAAQIGAVYLYASDGTLISTLTGSTANDQIGLTGAVLVGSSNFVVLSQQWSGGVGAATWVNGTTGLTGVVSSLNSLVGSHATDAVGTSVKRLSNGNYVVVTSNWSDDTHAALGAVTWGDGNSGVTGAVSSLNSLVGAAANDRVGEYSITPLANGDYVVQSPHWNSGAGAATWGSGSGGTTGAVSISNSLVGIAVTDLVGTRITALTNGGYVVAVPAWSSNLGAVTWSASGGVTGSVSGANSLIGTTAGDEVGFDAVTVLSNGNYVVGSNLWNNGTASTHFGAATWADGTHATTDNVATANSLYGTTNNDHVGTRVVALSNGSYVVASPSWSNGGNASIGAITMAPGNASSSGAISSSNSLIGTTTNDSIGSDGITALTNGNYVVASTQWSGGAAQGGAATWLDGTAPTTGTVAQANSLYGTHASDSVANAVIALANGNYVVQSFSWNNTAGAVTWGSGTAGVAGPVSTTNSLVGGTDFDTVGAHVVALSNGNYVVVSENWNGPAGVVGAVTWADGRTGTAGSVSASNSLVGTLANDLVGNGGVTAYADGNYVIWSFSWNNGTGAVTLANGKFRLKGAIQPWNSVYGTASSFDYDTTNQRLIVGQADKNIVSLFTMDQVFAGDFDP